MEIIFKKCSGREWLQCKSMFKKNGHEVKMKIFIHTIIFFVSFQVIAEIPEIRKLKPWQKIPAKVFAKYTSKEIGIALVEWISAHTEEPTGKEDFYLPSEIITKIPFDPMKDTEIQLYFPSENKGSTSCYQNIDIA